MTEGPFIRIIDMVNIGRTPLQIGVAPPETELIGSYARQK